MKHGAVVTSNGSVLATHPNLTRNHPRVVPDRLDHSSIHAEAGAIAAVKDKSRLRGATIYVARVNNEGTLRYSKPCDSCQQLIVEVGIRKVVHT